MKHTEIALNNRQWINIIFNVLMEYMYNIVANKDFSTILNIKTNINIRLCGIIHYFLFFEPIRRPIGLRILRGRPGPRLTSIGFSNKSLTISLDITIALSLLINDCLSSVLRCLLIFDTTSFALFCFADKTAFLANLFRIADCKWLH